MVAWTAGIMNQLRIRNRDHLAQLLADMAILMHQWAIADAKQCCVKEAQAAYVAAKYRIVEADFTSLAPQRMRIGSDVQASGNAPDPDVTGGGNTPAPEQHSR